MNEPLTLRSPAVAEVLAREKIGDRPGWNTVAEVLRDGEWSGRRCFVVGGGASLAGFDFGRLRGELTIGINRCFQFFDPTIVFGMDSDLLNIVRQDGPEAVVAAWRACPGLKVWLALADIDYSGVQTIKAVGRTGIPKSFAEGIFHGNNSGFGALQLALLLGASPIYLMGFDMKFTGGRIHFYDSPPRPDEKIYRGFAKHFDAIAPEIRDRVFNLNPDSGLRCFEFRDVDDVLRG